MAAIALLPLVFDLHKNLKTFTCGDDVKELQESLNKLGYNCSAVDGIFGDKTLAAVKAFQTAAGVKVDGIVGPVTRDALTTALTALPAIAADN